MPVWTPEHPDFYLSHWDKKLVSYEDDETLNVLLKLLPEKARILDVGSGSGRVARDVLGRFGTVTKADVLDLPDTVKLEPGRPLPFADGQFYVVHARRVFCCIESYEARLELLRELSRVAAGPVILVEPWAAPWRKLREIVKDQRPGLVLPHPNNERGLSLNELDYAGGPRISLKLYPIAAEYYYWTRCAGPIHFGRALTEADRAIPHPKFNIDMEHTVHRVLVWS